MTERAQAPEGATSEKPGSAGRDLTALTPEFIESEHARYSQAIAEKGLLQVWLNPYR